MNILTLYCSERQRVDGFPPDSIDSRFRPSADSWADRIPRPCKGQPIGSRSTSESGLFLSCSIRKTNTVRHSKPASTV